MKTGQRVFRYKTGAYTPVISDGRRIYLAGYSSINALATGPAEAEAGETHGGASPPTDQRALVPAGRSGTRRGGRGANRVKVKL